MKRPHPNSSRRIVAHQNASISTHLSPSLPISPKASKATPCHKPSLVKGRGLGWDINIIGTAGKQGELNLPRIATQSILGLNRRRLGIVNKFPLHSTCSIFLCYTEQLTSPAPIVTTIRICRAGSHLFKRRSSVSQFFYLHWIYGVP